MNTKKEWIKCKWHMDSGWASNVKISEIKAWRHSSGSFDWRPSIILDVGGAREYHYYPDFKKPKEDPLFLANVLSKEDIRIYEAQRA